MRSSFEFQQPDVVRGSLFQHAWKAFADPIYGGNRDMAGWKLVGFPGARYDYRDVVEKPQPGLPAAARRHQGRSGVGRELMARRLPRKDVVIVGLGWTGSILGL